MAGLATRRLPAFPALPALLCLLAFVVRVYRLNYQSFHYEEYFSVSLASKGLGEVLARLTLDEPHPPLYYSLLHLWTALAGDGEFAAKFLSLCFGVLIIPLGYRCGREVGGPVAALAAGLLLALNPFQFYHAQETRMYSAFELFALASSFFFLRLLQDDRRRLWVAYVVATTLAAATHYEMLLLIAAQVSFILGRALLARARTLADNLRHWIAAWAAVALLYLPWLVAARRIVFDYKSGAARAFVWPESASLAIQQARETFVAFNFHLVAVPYAEVQLVAIALVVLVAPAMALLWPFRKGTRSGACYLIVWAVLPITVALALDLRRPLFAIRYMVFVSPVLVILIALAAAQFARRSRWAAAALLLAVAFSYGQATYALYSDPAYSRADLRGVFQYLAAVARDGDALLLDCSYQDWAAHYYFQDRLPAFGFPLSEGALPEQREQLARLSAAYNRLWLLLGGDADCDPRRTVERDAAAVAFKGGDRTFSGLRLVAYAGAKRAAPLPDSTEPVDFGGHLRLMSWSMPQTPFEGGEVVPVRLLWQAEGKLDRDYAVSLRLLNAADQLTEQRDGMPQDGYRPTGDWQAGETVPDNRGLMLPLGLPRGDYRLELRVYDRADGKELPVRQPQTGKTTSSLLLARLEVRSAPPVPVAALAPLVPLDRQVGPLWAVGYRREGSLDLQPAARVRFTVYWQALERRPNNGAVGATASPTGALAATAAEAPGFELVLESLDGQPVQTRAFERIADLYPTAAWPPGALTRLDYDFVLAPTVPAGRYRLRGQQFWAGRREVLFVEPVTVRNPSPLPRATEAEIARPRRVALQQGALFLGYDLHGERGPAGDSLRAILYWSAARELAKDYTVFFHVLDSAGKIVAQADSPPARGAYPTTLWPVGDIIRDERVLPLANLPVARLAFGLYLPSTGERLCILADDGRCGGDSITIDGPFDLTGSQSPR